jgi:hypothetical protein
MLVSQSHIYMGDFLALPGSSSGIIQYLQKSKVDVGTLKYYPGHYDDGVSFFYRDIGFRFWSKRVFKALKYGLVLVESRVGLGAQKVDSSESNHVC